jgi:hypothetical protein
MPPNALRIGILQNKRESVRATKKPVSVRKLEFGRRLKARTHRLFVTQPKSARFLCPGWRDPLHFARNPYITHAAKHLAGCEIVEVNLGLPSIAADHD